MKYFTFEITKLKELEIRQIMKQAENYFSLGLLSKISKIRKDVDEFCSKPDQPVIVSEPYQ